MILRLIVLCQPCVHLDSGVILLSALGAGATDVNPNGSHEANAVPRIDNLEVPHSAGVVGEGRGAGSSLCRSLAAGLHRHHCEWGIGQSVNHTERQFTVCAECQ